MHTLSLNSSLPRLTDVYGTHPNSFFLIPKNNRYITNLKNSGSMKFLDKINTTDMEFSQLDVGLITAKQEKHKSIRNEYALKSRIALLQREDDKVLKRVELERKKVEEL